MKKLLFIFFIAIGLAYDASAINLLEAIQDLYKLEQAPEMYRQQLKKIEEQRINESNVLNKLQELKEEKEAIVNDIHNLDLLESSLVPEQDKVTLIGQVREIAEKKYGLNSYAIKNTNQFRNHYQGVYNNTCDKIFLLRKIELVNRE